MREYRSEEVPAAGLVAALNAASVEGWTLVCMHIHLGGAEPTFHVVWDRPLT